MEKALVKEKYENGLKDIVGTWKLEYMAINPMGAAGFFGRGLSSYPDPETGREVHRPKAGGGHYAIFMIGQLNMFLMPEIKPQDRLDIEWLINHPEVMVEGYDNYSGPYKRAKNTNSRVKLIALEHQEMKAIEEEDFIDKLIGKISLEGGKDAIGLERLRYILAELNLNYRDTRYITNKKVEKNVLKKKLKDFTRSSFDNAKRLDKVLSIMDEAKDTYYIKEMLRLHVIEVMNGMYKYKDFSLGISVAGIKEKWVAEPDLKVRMVGELKTLQES